ncbi:hypothetical protein V499_03592 [Pseudogymnoascus sp. VKM F-103]|nr:hypothetical protein V499_03592 [Pseudogymnoascus sp. VKM F-103]
MEDTSDLVAALRLDAEFIAGGVKHMRRVPKKKSGETLARIEEESSMETEENLFIDIEEIWDIEPGSIIGQGSFGIVRFERRRPLISDPTQSSQNQVRAVKEIRKLSTPDYMKEVQAVANFSQAQYEHFFIQSYGWFENTESVFITMEYCRLGDLARIRNREGPFPEKTTGLVARQVLEGIKFMHEINFAHRDLKPGNILVVSTSPWLVKIADFGISKQCHEGTQLQTQLGTTEYMAPELKGHFRSSHSISVYSISVDIWAIGVITMELLLTHPFLYSSDQEDYTRGIKPLRFDEPPGMNISKPCQDFIKLLLIPNPIHRPTAEAAISHSWFADVGLLLERENLLSVQDEVIPSQRHDIDASSPMPLLSWSTFGNLRLTSGSRSSTSGSRSTRGSQSTQGSRSSQGTQSSTSTLGTDNTVIDTYEGRPFDPSLLALSFRDLSFDKTKYFVLRSDNETDMETSFALGQWSAMKDANTRLDNGYRRSGGNVIIFFSIVRSQKFCGVARMTSPMDWDTTSEDWLPREDGREYQGQFTIEWLCLNELPFAGIRNVPAYLGKGRRAVAVMDGTAICPESGYELLRAYSEEDRRSPCLLERRRIEGVGA